MKTTKLTKLEQFVLDHENETWGSLAAQLNRSWRSIDQAHQRAIHKVAESKRIGDGRFTRLSCENALNQVTPADEGFAASRAEANVENVAAGRVVRFIPRYINMSAITDTATTISTQMWCKSQDDIYFAEHTLNKWITKDEEKWHGKVIFASMFDCCTKQLRTFKRDGNMLKEIEL
jgi:hypothetical protein